MRGNSDRFFYNIGGLGEEYLEVTDRDLVKQWRKVLRLTDCDVVRLFDGNGFEYRYQILGSRFQVGKKIEDQNLKIKNDKSIHLKLVDKIFFEEPKGRLVLGFGLLKGKERMEWLIEKVTELGVDELIPLVAQYSQVDRLRGKERLGKKIIEACEQCGRVRMPEIRANFQFSIYPSRDRTAAGIFQTYAEKYYKDYFKICFDGRGKKIDLADLKTKIQEKQNKVLLMVGPEGGWSEEEYDWLIKNNFLMLSFGPNVLRAETAGVVGMGLMKLIMNN
ncbi:MAG: RsmE family RNA methyltransferase [Patescibacteria group bacterium]